MKNIITNAKAIKIVNYRNLLIVFLVLTQPLISGVFAKSDSENLIDELHKTVLQKKTYEQKKLQQIDILKARLENTSLSLSEQFELCNKLYEEYKTFQYYAAFSYALKLREISQKLQDPIKSNYAKLQLSFTLLSSGMYKESLDSLNLVELHNMPNYILIEYYVLMSRCNYELAAYNDTPYFVEQYNKRGNVYSDSAIALMSKNDLQYYFVKGIRELKEKKYQEAEYDFMIILERFHPNFHDYAMTASALASVYLEGDGNRETATNLMIQAAIADIKSSTKEGVALAYVADLLYQQKHDDKAYLLIKEALNDASFYGAKLRLKHVSGILPVIEGNRLSTVEDQKNRLFIFTSIVSVLSLLVIIFAFIIFKQLRQLKVVEKEINETNLKLQSTNHLLQSTNQILQVKNNELQEANKIKEEYIGYSFNMYANYLDKLEKIKKSIEKKLITKNLESIGQVLDSINMKKEREALYISFDKIFIKLFPNFVPAFNSFFKDEDKYIFQTDHPLDIDIRIFALIRIGISDHEQIAKILEYSVRTIYNHKTKVKSKSILSNDEFEKKIMEIKAFELQ
jgi:hypothetical protein